MAEEHRAKFQASFDGPKVTPELRKLTAGLADIQFPQTTPSGVAYLPVLDVTPDIIREESRRIAALADVTERTNEIGSALTQLLWLAVQAQELAEWSREAQLLIDKLSVVTRHADGESLQIRLQADDHPTLET